MKKNAQNNHSDNNRRDNRKLQGTESFDPIGENIETIANLHKHAERNVSPQQRAIETITKFLGRPRFLFLILSVVALWVLINIMLAAFGRSGFDPPPFLCLSLTLSLGALLQTTVVLITQNRQDRMNERHTQLDLQISLLLDQKMSKLIEMIDEQRQNTSEGERSPDPQAEAMKEAIDPHQALATFEQLLDETDEEPKQV